MEKVYKLDDRRLKIKLEFYNNNIWICLSVAPLSGSGTRTFKSRLTTIYYLHSKHNQLTVSSYNEENKDFIKEHQSKIQECLLAFWQKMKPDFKIGG